MDVSPTARISHVELQGRTPVMSDVAEAMRADTREQQASSKPLAYLGEPAPMNGLNPSDIKWREPRTGILQGAQGISVDSDEAQAIAKKHNIAKELRINRLAETAGYLRWATLGLMTTTFGAFTAAAVTNSAAASAGFFVAVQSMTLGTAVAALGAPLFLAALATTLVVGASALAVSQKARHVQSEEWMNIQDFMQARTAAKVGKEVAKAMGKGGDEPKQANTRWQDKLESQAFERATETRSV